MESEDFGIVNDKKYPLQHIIKIKTLINHFNAMKLPQNLIKQRQLI